MSQSKCTALKKLYETTYVYGAYTKHKQVSCLGVGVKSYSENKALYTWKYSKIHDFRLTVARNYRYNYH